jgi:hypothetical protein
MMKNKVFTIKNPNGKFSVCLYSYEELGSGIRPILRLSGDAVFAAADEAAEYLCATLKDEIRENTEIVHLGENGRV